MLFKFQSFFTNGLWNLALGDRGGVIFWFLSMFDACRILLFGPKWVHSSRSSFMLLEYGWLVPNGCNYQTCHSWLHRPKCVQYRNHPRPWNMVFWSEKGAATESPYMLLEYGCLVLDFIKIIFNTYRICWNMVIWSLTDAIIKNVVHAPGIWLFGPEWVQFIQMIIYPSGSGYCIWSLMGATISNFVPAPGV